MAYSSIIQRRCIECKDEKPLSDFYLTKKRGNPYVPPRCKECIQHLRAIKSQALYPDLPNEKWAILFNGEYHFSNLGRVKSFARKHIFKIIKPVIANNGYPVYGFKVNGKHIVKTIHRLLGKYFIPNPNNLPCLNHKNGIKTDFRLVNLEWCTYAENNKHARETGLHRSALGEDVGKSKVTNKEALNIFNSKEKRTALAIKYNVSKDCIDDIKNGTSWGWLTGKKYNPRPAKRIIEFNGLSKNLTEWAAFFKVNKATLAEHLEKKPFEQVFIFYKNKRA